MELIVVIIFMAIEALVMRNEFGIIPFMTGNTADGLMFSRQRIRRPGMIEGFGGNQLLKRFLIMTAFAILSKTVVVRIFMTIGAIRELNPGILNKFFSLPGGGWMTFVAIHLGVFPF
jgi:hypothetical protein